MAPLTTMALDQFKLWIVLLTQTMSSFVLFPLSAVLSILLVWHPIHGNAALP